MRVLFATQSDSLRLFEALRADLDAKVGVEAAGFSLADSFAYARWLEANPDFEQRGYQLLKEWEVTARRRDKPDLNYLRAKEAELGGAAGLFGAIVADRRLIMGPDCTYSQDYRRRFTDEEFLRVLQAGVEAVEKLFDELTPDLVVGFICVTLLDYLIFLVAKARGVQVFNVRPTRVGDRITLSTTLNDPDPDFAAAYAEALETSSPWQEQAEAYIRRVREEHGRYEGVVRPAAEPALKVNRQRSRPWTAAARVWNNWRAYRSGPARDDNHVPHPLRALAFAALVNPLRARLARHRLSADYATPRTLQGRRYVFVPLHTEPEVSLLVYSRPYLNQIEMLRWLALSLPADMEVVVKEHPWMVGKRTLGAYGKMLEIPKVRIAPPETDARDLISGAEMVAVLTGSVALEAALLGKPVLTFGDCPYNMLPDRLVQRCSDPRRLVEQIQSILEPGPRDPDDRGRIAYMSAVYATTEGIALYSRLLAKQGVYVERETSYEEEVAKLGDYLLRRMQDPAPPKLPGTADW